MSKLSKQRKNSLERWKAALIKAMWATGRFTKQKITSYFTHPDRDINQGRISQIVDGKMLKDVPQASDSQLEAFLAHWKDKAAVKAKVFVADPLHETTIREIIEVKRGMPNLDVGESDYIECKQQLQWEKRERVGKAMSGMANNRGGYIVLGVEDGTYEIKGLPSDKLDIDPAEITEFLNNNFAPAVRWEHIATKLVGQSVVIIYVHEARGPA
jgi:Putative DNA-binding domain